MPDGLLRYYGTGDLHFITCSCCDGHPWLGTDERRDLFLGILEDARVKYRFVVAGYVIMPEHFHVLMTEPQIGDPSSAVGNVKQRFAQRVIPRTRRPRSARPLAESAKERGTPNTSTPVWLPRFYDFNVWSEEKRIEKLRYVHQNPVKRGLVDEPEQWRWSSCRYYSLGEIGLVRVNETDIMEMRRVS